MTVILRSCIYLPVGSKQLDSEMEGKVALLTGITGYVGSELARQLLAASAHLRCPVRCPLDSPRLSSLRTSFASLPGTITFLVRTWLLGSGFYAPFVASAVDPRTRYRKLSQHTLSFLRGQDADIRSEEAISEAAAGCDYVFHVASPFVITAEDAARDIVAPAVEGTTAVLRGAAHHKGNPLKRIVVTSSVCGEPAAVIKMRYSITGPLAAGVRQLEC